MIPRDCKRLAEVDFPIAVVSKHAAREKSLRHGNPSTLHLWWARRPIASCRAMLLALLLPDPCHALCPIAFKAKARNILKTVPGRVGETDEDLREALLRFIGNFADWDRAANATFLDAGRGLVRAAHSEELPLVVDPFAGGGSIPLEALRLGCDAFASDLNPVACLILKTMLEDMPRQGSALADELRRVASKIKTAMRKELAEFYPSEAGGARPIAFLWARTVRCEAPNCGAEIPLMRSFWLSKKRDHRKALRYTIQRRKDGPPRAIFEIFAPKTDAEVHRGSVSRAKATCLCCGTTLTPDRVRLQLQQLHGGADPVVDDGGKRTAGATLMAVVTKSEGQTGASYRLPRESDYRAVRSAMDAVKRIDSASRALGLAVIPDETLPLMSGTFNVPLYGINRWGDLFSRRQNLALATLVSHIRKTSASDPIKSCLAMVLGRCADYWSSGTRWAQSGEFVADTFARPALPIIFDFVEVMPFSSASGDFDGAVDWVARVIEALPGRMSPAQVSLQDARKSPLPDEVCAVWFTDPPYYFAVPYADLSDFFFVWDKRAFPDHALMHDPFDPKNPLSPKGPELCEMAHWDPVRYRHKDKSFFENGMAAAFSEGRRVTRDDGIASVVFAHKTTEGWEALLSGITRGGWIITGSWPIATERPGRPRSQDSAALATSIHLVCRPRNEDKVGDWAEVLRELPSRVSDWMARLESEGVHGADLVFACIGPALEIFSRYSRVETPDGSEVSLSEYLEKVWEVVGRSALEQVLGTVEAQARNGGLGALEEDSRLTALFLWTLGASSKDNLSDAADNEPEENDEPEDDDEGTPSKGAKGLTLIFDIVRRFAQPLGIHLDAWDKRIIETEKGVVRLLPVTERAIQLFGEAGADGLASAIENDPRKAAQLELFPAVDTDTPKIKGRGRKKTAASAATPYTGQVTTLDRVHAAMLLQRQGRTNALRSLLAAEAQRGPDFRRLANALSALYPQTSEEKRLLDAMLLAMPR